MTALALVALIVLIFVNGMFVAAEFALVRSRRARVESHAAAGRRNAARVVRHLD